MVVDIASILLPELDNRVREVAAGLCNVTRRERPALRRALEDVLEAPDSSELHRGNAALILSGLSALERRADPVDAMTLFFILLGTHHAGLTESERAQSQRRALHHQRRRRRP